jgi:hypothetical protein
VCSVLHIAYWSELFHSWLIIMCKAAHIKMTGHLSTCSRCVMSSCRVYRMSQQGNFWVSEQADGKAGRQAGSLSSAATHGSCTVECHNAPLLLNMYLKTVHWILNLKRSVKFDGYNFLVSSYYYIYYALSIYKCIEGSVCMYKWRIKMRTISSKLWLTQGVVFYISNF